MQDAKPKKKKQRFLFIKVLFLIVGALIAGLVIYDTVNYIMKNLNYVGAEAQVISRNEGRFNTLAVVAKFRVDRKTYIVESKRYEEKPPAIDTIVDIRYNPENPEDVIFVREKPYYKLGCGGLLLFVIGLLSLISGRKKQKRLQQNPQIKEN